MSQSLAASRDSGTPISRGPRSSGASAFAGCAPASAARPGSESQGMGDPMS
eukprot:CAMPEP_0171232766 /NCGR_PEP_ID=MMETSP0790-20130122/40576_1 /TAXON_ID=2925 /ORGANISM="Alexandrium catenella, Strain OF101" /LENGTH=50 /DNA_ID=CAMNT_0011699009 /DNA_START=91 /DNA_END=239 /DNA_ORIENTATION=-